MKWNVGGKLSFSMLGASPLENRDTIRCVRIRIDDDEAARRVLLQRQRRGAFTEVEGIDELEVLLTLTGVKVSQIRGPFERLLEHITVKVDDLGESKRTKLRMKIIAASSVISQRRHFVQQYAICSLRRFGGFRFHLALMTAAIFTKNSSS